MPLSAEVQYIQIPEGPYRPFMLLEAPDGSKKFAVASGSVEFNRIVFDFFSGPESAKFAQAVEAANATCGSKRRLGIVELDDDYQFHLRRFRVS